jgi:uncharacterized protein YutE (UPF0331/DUF86 family)
VVDADLITAKLAELMGRVARVREHAQDTPEQLAQSTDSLDITAFNLMLAVQSALDVCGYLIVDEVWARASSPAEAFERLRQHEVLSAETTASMQRTANVRDLIAYGYAETDIKSIHHAATTGLVDLEEFSCEVAVWLGSR